MRQLMTMLGLGTVAFLAICMVQEWQVFAPWLGLSSSVPTIVTEDQRAAVEGVLRDALMAERHFYVSGGDPRFLDRMPAGQPFLDELAANAAYLGRNNRYEDPALVELEVLGVRGLGPHALEVRTKEYWIVRTRWLADGAECESPRSLVCHQRYLVVSEGGRWRVEARDFAEPPSAEVVTVEPAG